MKRLLLIASVISLASAAVAWLSISSSIEDQLKNACSAVLADRLRSPSTLQVRAWSELLRRPATELEYVGLPPDRSFYGEKYWPQMHDVYETSQFLYRSAHPDIILLVIDYDAQNAFGAPVRAMAECSYFVHGKDDPSLISEPIVRIDGMTALEWSTDQLVRSMQTR